MGTRKKDSTIIHKVLDGEATQSETRQLKKKLKADANVKAEYESLKHVQEMTHKLPEPASSAAFRKKVLRKLK